ncbi:hypothetical protein AJ79_06484 [Helicocarpus griseus UAMH5409]|uniref:Carboxylesterase type B domain-containing protein n=1 Tax=Helicocarpus griseus UAMH5409 TaxID=1447875 RepID=A0A2B7XC71_9EURO|nr:hypothetical protein AJ79_06484 [Helicocarpus griseus UAMH5409]
MKFAKTTAALTIVAISFANPTNPTDPFPTVDLGYATHVPTYINETSSGFRYANYNNIRFAEPPLGALRFRRPKTPPPKQYGIQNGSAPRFATDCVSAVPGIFPDLGIGTRSWGREDCLFLNVRVPEGAKEGDNLPVIHWVHGSAFVYGSKDFKEAVGDGSGLYDDLDPSSQKFIYVASNYRMGLYGWSSSPSEDMSANVGLHDTLAALRWTQKYISKFGGDPRRITAFGHSAGAGMINLLLVARGGHEDLPFSQAFIASPAVWPRREPSRRQAMFNEVLKAANCTSVDCLREASEATLLNANTHLIVDLSGTYSGALGPGAGFTPVVDGKYIEDLLPVLLQRGKYNRRIKKLAASNMAHDGALMVPLEGMPEIFPEYVRGTIPNASNETIERIRSLYSYPPELPIKLGWDWATDVVFACNAYLTAKAYANRSQRHVMSMSPAAHGQDLNYWFFQNNITTPVANVTMARQFQEYVRRFVTGARNTMTFKRLEDWPLYGWSETVFNVTSRGFERQRDYWEQNQRCQILGDIIDDPENGA